MKYSCQYIFPIALAVCLLMGCEKSESGCHQISFDVQLADEIQTKAPGCINSLSSIDPEFKSFMLWGYDGTKKDIDGRTVKRFDSGVWGFEDKPLVWVDGKTRTFWSYANLPSYVTVTANSSTQATVTVTSAGIPVAVANQWDPLVGYYNGKGVNGKASIIFYHPLTAVKFVTGNKGDSKYNITGISSVTMKNVHKSGTATTSNGTSYSWTPSGTTNVTGGFTGTASTIPFIVIPQNLSSNPVLVEITVTRSSGGNKTMYATLDSGSWEAGKLNVYTLDYVNDTMTATLTVTLENWGTVTNQNGTPSVTSDDLSYFIATFD